MDSLYWIVAITAIVTGIYLLAIKYDGHLDLRSYRVIRHLLAAGAFLDGAICLAALFCINHGYATAILDQHLIPVFFNVQLSIMAYAMMRLLHTDHIDKYTPLVYNISAGIAAITISISYCVWSGCVSSSPAFLMMYSAYKINKQGDNIQP